DGDGGAVEVVAGGLAGGKHDRVDAAEDAADGEQIGQHEHQLAEVRPGAALSTFAHSGHASTRSRALPRSRDAQVYAATGPAPVRGEPVPDQVGLRPDEGRPASGVSFEYVPQQREIRFQGVDGVAEIALRIENGAGEDVVARDDGGVGRVQPHRTRLADAVA